MTVLDGMEQARYIADKVLDNREVGAALKAQAVLFRAGHHSALLELELGRRNIPFVKFGGLRFLEPTSRDEDKKSTRNSSLSTVITHFPKSATHRPHTGIPIGQPYSSVRMSVPTALF